MNTTQDPIPLFGDDSFESVTDTASNSEGSSADDGHPEHTDSRAEELAAALNSASAESASENPASDTLVQPAVTSPGEPYVPASSAMTRIGSEQDMDAWLSGDPGIQTGGHQPSGAWVPTDAAADAAMAAWIAADPNAPSSQAVDEGPVVVGPGGRVDRTRAEREPLVPTWLPWVLAGVLLVAGIFAGAAALLSAHARVIVPTVAGLTAQVARERVTTVGLKLTVSDRRFSTLPVDTILSQTPDAGATATRGSAVTVVVSGGTEEFNMPDVVGQGLTLARSQLEQKGLDIQVDVQPSDQPSDTVLATNPTAGSPMHTGDVVRLTVAQSTAATGTVSTGTLVPFSLSGVKVTIDPSAPVAGQPDAALEVARRLQSLLEASGATVKPTRSSADTGTAISVTARQSRAKESSATLAVGLDVVSSGLPGVIVTYPSSSVATAAAAPSLQLASQIASGFSGSGLTVRQSPTGSDLVLTGASSPYSRITLGTTGSTDDLANFRDANWADKVARAIYQGIGAIYGVRNSTP